MSSETNPFLFGQTVEDTCFFNRTEEQASLKSAFESGQNTILIAPRRYGKSSLIRKVLKNLDPNKFFFIYTDLFRTNTLKKFNDLISQSIAKATGTPLKQFGKFLKQWAPKLTPRVIFRGDDLPEVDFEFSPSSEKAEAVLGELLEIPQKFAQKTGKRGIVVFDEFQEILQFGNVSLLKEIRAIIQHHQSIAYCFAGSKRHLISEMFIDSESPFYQFGKIMSIGSLPRNEFFAFITKNLKPSAIPEINSLTNRILDFTDCHPYHTQMFCSYFWDLAKQSKDASFENTLDHVLKNQLYAYTAFWDRLTARQRNLLIALVRDPHNPLHTAEAIMKWALGSSATVTKVTKILEREGFIERDAYRRLRIADPFFATWIQKI